MYKIINQKIFNKLNIILLSIFISVFYFNFCIAEYNKANEDGTEISTSTAQELELQFPERESGKLKNELGELNQNDSSMNIINYKKPYFWLLLFALILIVFILLRLFKKLSHMDREFKRYENKVKSKDQEQISDDREISNNDEVVYSINDTNNIKPIAKNDEIISEIKITKNINNNEAETEIPKKIHINSESENQNINIKNQDENKNNETDEDEDDYIFE